GLGYDELAAINPGLVLVRVTGFGQSGPYSARAGYGSIGEALGGMRSVSGNPDSAPSRVGISIGDSLGGAFAAYGAVVALHARRTTGRGQVVDSAIYEAVLAMMESLVPEYAVGGYTRERTGATLPNIAPSNVYPTADDEMVLIAANQDTVFRRLAGVMEQPDLATDDRFATHTARGRHHAELDELIATWTATLKAGDLLATLDDSGVPAGRIFKAADMLEDPHFQAREDIVRLPHPAFGEFPMHGVFPRLSETPGSVRWVGPELGEHNDEVYGGLLGLDENEQAELHTGGVI
ncbi:MAG: CaiB/BaiF CoA transferase family protein, partial [Nocardioidaceae bacterium]